jgi:opacity protein-like surface antigen
MKLVKSLLLGSVAGLAAVAGAQAADLPVKKAAPVEYVRVCSTYGTGFFYIPGTETCLRIGGRVRAEMGYIEPFERETDALGFRALARIQLDTRTATAYGLLRTFTRVTTNVSSGAIYGRGPGEVSSGGVALEQAYIQFGGLTAGRATSFFSNADLPNTNMGTLRFDDAPDQNLFAYTFSFGNGFSATLSLEDGIQRRSTSATLLGPLDDEDAPIFDPVIGYGGQRVPDVVANLKYDGTWGGAQLSGAVHQVRSAVPTVDTEYGYAVGASAYVNLPALAPGDALWVFATYAQGAPSYAGFGDFTPLAGPGAPGFGGVPDAVVSGDDIRLTETWSIAGGFTHNWTPNVNSSLFGSYAVVDFGRGAVTAVDGTLAGLADFREWRIGANTFWSPVSGLNLGVEVIYADADFRGVLAPAARANIGNDIGAFEGRVRVQRDF